MAAPVTVPRLGWSMDEGTFVEWLKQDGDHVKPGEPLFVLESEKAAENIEAIDAGILRIPPKGPKPGETVAVGRVLAFLVAEGEGIPDTETQSTPREPEAPARANATSPPLALRAQGTAITPRARRAARELGIDPVAIRGTGKGGRVRERDVRAACSPLAPREEGASLSRSERATIPHTRIRRLTAARMVAGVTQAAPVTLTARVDATELVALRDRLRAATLPDTPSPTYTDVIVKHTAAALRQHPLLQAQWRDDALWIPDGVHIAIAVDTEAGLLAPVIRDADKLDFVQIAARSHALIAEARAGRLGADQMRDATFTITNLGMFGIDAFTPIIHLPQCAVLGIGRIGREPAVVEDRIEPRHVVTLSLTFDHRVVDGAPAARFLSTIRNAIEQPILQ